MRRFERTKIGNKKISCGLISVCLPTISFLVLLFCVGYPSAALSEGELPKMIVSDPSFDFGSIPEGEAVSHDFQIDNKGTATLHIQRVVPSCGCTSASSTEFIEPGESGSINVKFDTTGYAGDKVKTVRVYTNDNDNPASILTIKGSIVPDITVEPKRVVFEDVLQGQSASQEVTVKVREDSKLELKDIESHSPYVEIEDVSGNGKVRKFKVTLSSELKLGDFRERIAVGLTGGDRSAVNVPIFATVKGPLRLDPTSVSFGILEGNEPLTRSVRFENFGENPIQIVSLQSNNPAVKVAHKTIRKGQIFVIQITVNPKDVDADLRALIDIKTNSEDQDALSLSVYGVLPPKA